MPYSVPALMYGLSASGITSVIQNWSIRCCGKAFHSPHSMAVRDSTALSSSTIKSRSTSAKWTKALSEALHQRGQHTRHELCYASQLASLLLVHPDVNCNLLVLSKIFNLVFLLNARFNGAIKIARPVSRSSEMSSDIKDSDLRLAITLIFHHSRKFEGRLVS